MAKRRRGRKAELVIDTIRLLLLLVLLVFVSGSPLLAWFRQRPWAVTLAIIIVVSGMLGLIAFFVTWQQMRRTERLRRLRAESDWLKLTPPQFEEYVAELFRAKGYHAWVTGGTADGGIDIQLEKGGQRAIVQCKRYNPGTNVNVEQMRAFCSVVHHAKAQGYFVTSSSFTSDALDWAKKSQVVTIDSDELVIWMKEAKFGPYAEPMPSPPLFFTAGQWLTLTLLVAAVIGVFGFFLGLLVWG